MYVYPEACEYLGLEEAEVKRIVKKLSKAIKEANDLGLFPFGSGECDLRTQAGLLVAQVDGRVDGGAGDAQEDENGLIWAEYSRGFQT